MYVTYDATAPKKPANLSINSDLLQQAKDMDINLSAALEHALKEKLKEKFAIKWREENKKTIAAYNKYVDAHGTFGDKTRSF
jgi:antitoxin CcdA